MKKSAALRPSAPRPPTVATGGCMVLRLYVAGQTPRSLAAIANLKKICEENYQGNYTIEVVDLILYPASARADQIVAIPTLVRRVPAPMRKVIGDLSNMERVLIGLDMGPSSKERASE